MASNKIKGITIEIGGDTTKLGKAISNAETNTRSLQGELKQVEKLLQFDPGNTELLAQKQKILTEAIEETSKKLKTLKDAEEQVIDQFNRGDIGEDQLRAFQREIVKTENDLKGFRGKLDGTSDDIKDVGESAEESSDGFTIMKGALSDLVSNAIQGAISAIGDFLGSLLELSEATEEYRTMQAKLEGSSKTFGYSVDFANQKYKEFYKYLGDDQASTNAITNLMGIGTSTESISKLAEGATAVWASYGDSIPIEGLTEAINETVTCGKVTGSMADTINWAKDANTNLNKALGGNKDAQKAYNEALKEGLPVEDAFNEALAKITDEQERADVVAQFLNSTYGESKNTYDELNKSVTDANEAELALKDTQADLGETMAPVNNALTDMKNQALQAIAPLVESLANSFMDLYKWMQENPVAMQLLTGVAIALATAFGILATALAIQGIINGVTKAIAFLNTTLLANPIVLIVALIAGLVAGFIYLWNNCEAFRNFFVNLWENIKTVVSNVVGAIVEFFTVTIPEKWSQFLTFCSTFIENIITFFSELPGKIWTWLLNVIAKFLEWRSNMIEKAKEVGSKVLNTIVDFFKQLPGKIWTWLLNIITKFLEWRNNMISKAKEVGMNVLNTIVNFFKQLPGKIWETLLKAIAKFLEWRNNIVAKAKEVGSNVLNTIFNFFKQIPGKVWSAISGAIGKMATWGSNMLSKAKTAITNVASAITGGLKSLPSKLGSIGKDLVTGLWNGIKNMTSWIKDKIKGFGESVVNGLKDFFGIHSPSRLMRDQIGKYVAEGIGVGITENEDVPIDALKDLGDDMANQDLAINGATINRKLNTTFASNTDPINNTSLLDKLDGIYEKLGRLQIVLDTGTLVGETIDKIDAGLANKQLLTARGV